MLLRQRLVLQWGISDFRPLKGVKTKKIAEKRVNFRDIFEIQKYVTNKISIVVN
jgi:hypothetical protein